MKNWCDFDGTMCGGLHYSGKTSCADTWPVQWHPLPTTLSHFELLRHCTSQTHYSWIKIPRWQQLGSPQQCEKNVQIGLKHNIWVQLVAWLRPSQISLSLKWTVAAYSSSPINPSPSTYTFEESVVKYLSYNLFFVRRYRYQLSVTACKP